MIIRVLAVLAVFVCMGSPALAMSASPSSANPRITAHRPPVEGAFNLLDLAVLAGAAVALTVVGMAVRRFSARVEVATAEPAVVQVKATEPRPLQTPAATS